MESIWALYVSVAAIFVVLIYWLPKINANLRWIKVLLGRQNGIDLSDIEE